MRISRTARKHLALSAALGAAVAIVPGTATAAGPENDQRIVPKIEGLDGPRGIAVGSPRSIFYAEADGTVSRTVLRGEGEGTTVLGTVGAPGIAPAVSHWRENRAHILTGFGEEAETNARLYTWSRRSGDVVELADIGEYQQGDPDPDNQEGDPAETNPYGVATLEDGCALVADAAGNDLLKVAPNGDIVTVARIKPRVVLVPDELEGIEGMPPPGTPIPAEGVVTSVTVGADGAYYVGELRGFPATPGTSQVWRIEAGAEDAVCDPEHPNDGACTRYADGFTSIVDLAAGPDGDLYVLELCKQSWLQFELGIAEPTGGLYRVPAGGGEGDLISSDRLTLPGGVDTSRTGRPFVAGPVFGEGAIVRVR
jgi:hypothetical protein